MPLPSSKAELRARLDAAFVKLDAVLAEVPAAQARHERGAVRSPAFWVAYQCGWGRCLLAWDAAGRRGRTPVMPAPGFRWNQLGELAASFAHARRARTFAQLRAEFVRTQKALLAMVDRSDERDLLQVGRVAWAGPKWPLVKWLQVNTVAPWTSARAKVRKWLALGGAAKA